MISTPWITRTAEQLAAVIHLTIPRDRIQFEMGPALGEIMAAVKAQGVGPSGPWFTHHRRMSPAEFDFEVCVPVSAPVAATGRVASATFPAATVARTVHHGPYEELATSWKAFGEWLAANGHAVGQELYECYVAGPESSPDPAQWRTELTRPLAGIPTTP